MDLQPLTAHKWHLVALWGSTSPGYPYHIPTTDLARLVPISQRELHGVSEILILKI